MRVSSADRASCTYGASTLSSNRWKIRNRQLKPVPPRGRPWCSSAMVRRGFQDAGGAREPPAGAATQGGADHGVSTAPSAEPRPLATTSRGKPSRAWPTRTTSATEVACMLSPTAPGARPSGCRSALFPAVPSAARAGTGPANARDAPALSVAYGTRSVRWLERLGLQWLESGGRPIA